MIFFEKSRVNCSIFSSIEMPIPKDKSILIIDDDKDLTNLYETFLEYDGYKVDTFTDPIDALYSFKKMHMIWFLLI